MKAVLKLPEIHDRHAFNLARWKEICADPCLAHIEGRVESDAFGNILMSPPPGFNHSLRQTDIIHRLFHLPGGKVLAECPVSTAKGIRGVDVIWISDKLRRRALRDNVLVIAPEICVEVLSPGNTPVEMDEKRSLLFDAGALEVWFCDTSGNMFFFTQPNPDTPVLASQLCPDFPQQIA